MTLSRFVDHRGGYRRVRGAVSSAALGQAGAPWGARGKQRSPSAAIAASSSEGNRTIFVLVDPMAQELSTEDAKTLLALCGSGRLYAIEAWVQAGRSLQVP